MPRRGAGQQTVLRIPQTASQIATLNRESWRVWPLKRVLTNLIMKAEHVILVFGQIQGVVGGIARGEIVVDVVAQMRVGGRVFVAQQLAVEK